MSLDGIVSKAWESVTVPGRRPPVTMVTEAERQLLYYLASRYFSDAGHIIDTGSLFGGSTLALGYGLREWRKRNRRAPLHRIHAYDLFTAQQWMFKQHLSAESYTVGQSLLPVFEKNIKPVAEFVAVHPGDIRKQQRPDGRIEILFVDVAKTPELSDFVVREFFPALIPGRSIVIQQDYMYDFDVAAWLHITMEYYSDYFRILTDTTYNSVAFLYEREIPLDRLKQHSSAALSVDERLDLMVRARKRFAGTQADTMLRAHYEYLISRDWPRACDDAHCIAHKTAMFVLRPGGDSDGLARAFAEMIRLARRCRDLELLVDSFEQSSSWRLTAPVRAAGRFLQSLGLRRQRPLRAR